MSGGSKEAMLSVQTYSGKEIGQINKDATNKEIQLFIQETTKNKSHVRLMRTEDAIMFEFIDNRHALLEWDKAYEYGWLLELDANKWKRCTFEGTTLIKINLSSAELTTLPDLSKCVSLERLDCSHNLLTELPDLSKCVLLTYVNCRENKFAELPDLFKCVLLKYLYCYGNHLTEEPKVPSGTNVYK